MYPKTGAKPKNSVSIDSQVAALELAIGHGGPAIFREGHHEIHRKQLEAALRTLRFVQQNEAAITAVVGAAFP